MQQEGCGRRMQEGYIYKKGYRRRGTGVKGASRRVQEEGWREAGPQADSQSTKYLLIPGVSLQPNSSPDCSCTLKPTGPSEKGLTTP